MLPNNLLAAATNHQVMVELKNGDTYSGLLVKVDKFMNLQIRDTICIAASSADVKRVADMYIRGSAVKYLRLPPEVEDVAKSRPAETGKAGKKGKGKRAKGESAGPQGQRAGGAAGASSRAVGGGQKRDAGGNPRTGGGPPAKAPKRE